MAVVFLALATHGAAYFVDYVGGSDSNNGTSTNTPWKRFPGGSGATGVPAGISTLSPGDSITFKAGVTNIGTAGLRGSGTIGNYITYLAATNWGTGTNAYFTTSFAPATSGFTSGTTARSYNHFKNLHFFQFGGWPYNDPVFSGASNTITAAMGLARIGNGFSFSALITGFFFENCAFFENGHQTNVIQNTSGLCVVGSGITFGNGAISNIIWNCDFRQVQIPLRFTAMPSQPVINNMVRHSRFKGDFNWGIDWSANAANTSILTNWVEDCTFWNWGGWDQTTWKGDPTGAVYDSPHTNAGIHRQNQNLNVNWGDGGVRWSRNRFYYQDVPNTAGTSALFMTRNPSVWIDNNIFSSISQPVYVLVAHSSYQSPQAQHVRIRHNTFEGSQTFIRVLAFSGGESDAGRIAFTATNRNVHIQNNIFRKTANNRVLLVEQNTNVLKTLDGNLYYITTLAESAWSNLAQFLGVNQTLSQVKARGYEGNGLFGNPMYTSGAYPWATANFAPLEGSAAINAGLNLTNVVPFDFNNMARATRPLTIGAYAYNALVPGDVTPPSPDPMTWVSTPAIIGDGRTIYMEWTTATDAGGTVTYHITEHTGNPGCSGASSTTATSFTDTDVGYNTTCTYSITASDPTGNTTAATPQGSATSVIEPPPFAMTAVTLTATVANVGMTMTNLFFFDAEEVGTPTGYTNTGTLDWDDSFAPYEGTQALYVENTNVASYTSVKWISTTNFTVQGAIRRTTIGPVPRRLVWFGTDGSDIGGLEVSTNGFHFNHGTVTNLVSFQGMSTTYYTYDFALETSTGANGRAYLNVHTNFTFSASSRTNSISTGTGTTGFNQGFWGNPLAMEIGPVRFDRTLGRAGYRSLGDNAAP